MKRLIYLTLTGALLAAPFATTASAGEHDRGERRHAVSRNDDRHDRGRRDDHRVSGPRRYFGSRDVVIVRDYYRPHYRPAPRGAGRVVYVRDRYLPPGWERRLAVVPVYVERQLLPLPYGYNRGIIDGQLVVHDRRGLIVDVALLF